VGSILHPVGPLPPGAYWLRRGLALALIALVVAAGWWAFGRDGGPAAQAAGPGPSTSASTTAHATVSATVTPKTTTSPKPTVSPKATVSPSVAPVACAASAVRVEAATDAASYAAGRRPLLSLIVTNTGSVPCLRNVGQGAVTLTVTSGGVRIWSSEDCAPGGPLGPQLIAPGSKVTHGVSWTRLTSKVGCPAGLPTAPPGSYDLVATNEAIASQAVRFILR